MHSRLHRVLLRCMARVLDRRRQLPTEGCGASSGHLLQELLSMLQVPTLVAIR